MFTPTVLSFSLILPHMCPTQSESCLSRKTLRSLYLHSYLLPFCVTSSGTSLLSDSSSFIFPFRRLNSCLSFFDLFESTPQGPSQSIVLTVLGCRYYSDLVLSRGLTPRRGWVSRHRKESPRVVFHFFRTTCLGFVLSNDLSRFQPSHAPPSINVHQVKFTFTTFITVSFT